jgi:probable HAF family extracellular repeat protein
MKGISNRLFNLCFLCAIFGFCVAATAQCKYTTLNIPGAVTSTAFGINDQGAIVGAFTTSTTDDRGFLLFQGQFSHFNFPGAESTEAEDINNNGQIVGDYLNVKTGQHGFLVHNGVFSSFSDPSAPSQTQALGINNFGTIVGMAGVNGFRLSGGKFTTIRFPGSTRTVAHGINDSGIIVGTYGDAKNFNHGFMLKNGVYTTIDFPGATDTAVNRIDNEGDIVGSYDINGGDVHGFTLDKGRFLTHDDPNAGMSTFILDVNKFDTIVGGYVDVGGHNHSFRASCAGVF